MKRLIEKIEKYLLRITIMVFIALVVIQGLMTDDKMRFYLSLSERLDGQVIEVPAVVNPEEKADLQSSEINSPYALIVLKVEKYSALPKAVILVNGKAEAAFTDHEVELKVMAGDVIEIDSSAYNFPVEYKVKEVSENLAFPVRDQICTGNHDIVMLGKIVVK